MAALNREEMVPRRGSGSGSGGRAPRVLVAAELRDLLPEDPLPGYRVVWVSSSEPTPKGDFVAMVPLLSRPVGDEELAGLPGLRVVAQCAVGYDNIDLKAAARRGVPVTNTPDVLTESTADLAWALILAVARRLKEGQALLARDEWTGWSPTQLLGVELNGSTLGIVGGGRIGQAVGRRGKGFGMRILYSDREDKEGFQRETGATRTELGELLSRADVVTVHVPSTAETRGMFDAGLFGSMKPGALFINTARGDLVDEKVLLEAVENGPLAGAGLDVFSQEPQVPRFLVEHPRVVTLPHIGSATTRTRKGMAELAIRNARAVLAGEDPVTPVPLPAVDD